MKKKINIVLIVAVLGLWGSVIYKYLNQYFIKNYQILSTSNDFDFASVRISSKDTFELKSINRDPFLNSLTIKPEINNSITFKKYSPIIVKPNNLKKDFPSINYLGFIKSIDKQNELVLLKVNGKFLKFRINEVKDNLKVLKIHKDSILVKYGEIKKAIKFSE